ncbi:MAG: hypothetical protein R6T98_12370, partial [Desulfatiglandales bacterium]
IPLQAGQIARPPRLSGCDGGQARPPRLRERRLAMAGRFEAFRPSFWNLAKHLMNPKMGIMSE